MKAIHIFIDVPIDFNFWRTVYSHGWCSLRPFSVDKENRMLNRLLHLENDSLAFCQITAHNNSQLKINIQSKFPVNGTMQKQIRAKISTMLRLDEDFAEFHRESRRYPRYRWISSMKVGRMLRAPSVFEDIIKMICTTNCSWSLTEIMTNNLIDEFGKSFENSKQTFPSAEALAGTTEQFLRKSIKTGYRSPFILEFATNVANGKLNIEQWRNSPLATEVLYKELLNIKGVGMYAAGNILKLLGRYDFLGLDSWVRGQYYNLYHNGRVVSDKTIERLYKPFGRWRGLFFWLEMTKHWFKKEIPF
jgi:N-glycosylase/DNA lyase